MATDQPLVRFGAEQAVIRGAVVRDGRETMVELELNPGRANRARLGRSPCRRPRDVLGTLRTVLFAPEDLALVKGDPSRAPQVPRRPARRPATPLGQRARRLRQDPQAAQRPAEVGGTGAAAGTSAARRRGPPTNRSRTPAPPRCTPSTSGTTTSPTVGSQLLYARLRLLRDLGPYLATAYDEVSAGSPTPGSPTSARCARRPSASLARARCPEIDRAPHRAPRRPSTRLRDREVERGMSLVGPHRDDLVLSLGDLPAKGYASHGESWSFALGLKLAAYQLLRHDLGDDPVLILDDVFAELDTGRRERLAAMVADCEQVLITAAVDADVPSTLTGRTYAVSLGEVSLRE